MSSQLFARNRQTECVERNPISGDAVNGAALIPAKPGTLTRKPIIEGVCSTSPRRGWHARAPPRSYFKVNVESDIILKLSRPTSKTKRGPTRKTAPPPRGLGIFFLESDQSTTNEFITVPASPFESFNADAALSKATRGALYGLFFFRFVKSSFKR
ncbi:hypothetical protein EVAR_52773_1 [Eumeta japonica]|uniref:Uncharacterized protein n=1 Tax=Eumeta variegata TaxID=151549 RepID=A0A4C1XFP7_EUMVA|nr:hypothetical protein EVAR_52773_1 [Eumeta japonica]